MISPVIICIAKYEKYYIEEFVRYHLGLGFEKIYIYDNEDDPTYAELLKHFKDKVVVNHLPGKNYSRLPQYEALQQFTHNYMGSPDITHVAHIDIDEFIVLNKHDNIKEFIKDFINDGENGIMCGGIGINWRFFGSSGNETRPNEPLTSRFIKRQSIGNHHLKTIYNKQFYGYYNNPHNICVNNNNYPIKDTNGNILDGPFNENMDFSAIQINHYKCKTWEEYKIIRSRGRADRYDNPGYDEGIESLLNDFKLYDTNDVEDLTAFTFYKKLLDAELEGK
jgi:hypothetical protein